MVFVLTLQRKGMDTVAHEPVHRNSVAQCRQHTRSQQPLGTGIDTRHRIHNTRHTTVMPSVTSVSLSPGTSDVQRDEPLSPILNVLNERTHCLQAGVGVCLGFVV